MFVKSFETNGYIILISRPVIMFFTIEPQWVCVTQGILSLKLKWYIN